MNATRKVKLKDITDNLTCHLCKGYIIDATTIIECLHSFCKSCIVKHLDKNEYFCPVCDVQLHSTKPLSSIRSDQMLQEIIYKLVPGLFRKEMSRRREFYDEHTESKATNQMDSGQVFNELYITSDDIIHLSLEYFTADTNFKDDTKRYLKCPAAVSISILKKLVQGKFDLKNDVQIDIMYGERILPDEFLLMDVAYKYSWTSHGSKPLQLKYRVRGFSPPPPVLSSTTKSNATPTPASISKRQRRTKTTDTEVSSNRSEILKSSNRNLPGDTNAQNQISSTTPKLTPNGKVRGRRKRNINADGEVEPVATKKKKVGKNTPVKDYKEMESQSDASMSKPSMNNSTNTEKEVQLRISENGVISARSINSGEEKIIGNLGKSQTNGEESSTSKGLEPKNGLKSTDDTKHTNESKDNGISLTLNPLPVLSSVHPLLVSSSAAMPSKSNYVKLNIPNVSTASASMAPVASNSSAVSKSPNLKQEATTNSYVSNVNGSASAKIPISTAQKTNSPKRKYNTDKTKNQSKSPNNGLVGKSSPIEFENKKANVKKALIDLEKKLSTDLDMTLHNAIPKGGLIPIKSTMGISSNNKDNSNSQTDASNSSNTANGTSLNEQLKQGLQPAGSSSSNSSTTASGEQVKSFQPSTKTAFTFPSSFDSTGMIVIPLNSSTIANNSSSGITSLTSSASSSQKRFAHQTTVVNGDLKFTTTPRHILPSPCKDNTKGSSKIEASPKKPPKFFKSRHSSPTLSSDGESPKKKPKETITTKAGIGNINGNTNLQFNTITTKISIGTSTGSNTTTTPSGFTSVQNPISRFPLNMSNGYNPMDNNYLQSLQMSLAAAAASNGNGLPLNLVPFVTSNYCSMPFLRSPLNMNFAPHLQFPYSYHGMNSLNLTQATTAPVPLSIGTGNDKSCGLSMTSQSQSSSRVSSTADEGSKGLLDLSINKDVNRIKSDKGFDDVKSPRKLVPLTVLKSSETKNGESQKETSVTEPKKTLIPLQPKGSEAMRITPVSKFDLGVFFKSRASEVQKINNKSLNSDSGPLGTNANKIKELVKPSGTENPKKINDTSNDNPILQNGHDSNHAEPNLNVNKGKDPSSSDSGISGVKNNLKESVKSEVPVSTSCASVAETLVKPEEKASTLKLLNGDINNSTVENIEKATTNKTPTPCNNNNNNNSSESIHVSQKSSTTTGA